MNIDYIKLAKQNRIQALRSLRARKSRSVERENVHFLRFVSRRKQMTFAARSSVWPQTPTLQPVA